MLLFVLALAPLPEPDYQKVADATAWEWKAAEATTAFCAGRQTGAFKVEVVEQAMGLGAAAIRFTRDGKEVHVLEGHAGTVFITAKDGTLYYADYSPFSTGCSLVAFDLTARKQLWRAHLKGLGPILHTKYRNAVRLDLLPDGALRVFGQESAGDYVEFVDGKTGKTLGHKVFPRP
jgi:hypothetical protein